MLGRLLLLFILTPLIELWLLMLVSERMGATTTILIVLATGTLGATLAKRQGLQNWHAIQASTQQGQIPAVALVDSLMIFMAGLLLITPGILTDLVGFSLLIPPVRAGIRHRLRSYFTVRATMQAQTYGQSMFTGFTSRPPGTADGPFVSGQAPPPDVIDVEFERKSPDSE